MDTNELEHEKIRLKIEGIKASQEAAFFMINLSLDDLKKDIAATLEQTSGQKNYCSKCKIETNTRLEILEKDNQTVRMLKSKKWMIILLSIGIFKVYELIDLNWIFTKLISLF